MQAPAAAPTAPAPMPRAGLVAPDGKIHLALLVPISGPGEKVGRALLNASQMALFDLGGTDLALDVYDTQGTPQGAYAALQAAKAAQSALVLGPLFSGSAQSIKADAAAYGVPVLSFSSDETVAGNGLYTLGISPAMQVDRVVDFTARLGVHAYAALVPRSPYGDAALAAFQAAVTRNGGSVTKTVGYTPGSTDLSPEVRDLATAAAKDGGLAQQRRQYLASAQQGGQQGAEASAALSGGGTGGFGALLLPAGGSELINLASLLPYYDVDPENVQFLGMQNWNDPALTKEPALVGGWFAAPDPRAWQVFSGRYASLYGQNPPRLASLGYDAMAVAAVVSADARSAGEPAISRQRLENPVGFAGVDGIFRFEADGTLQRGLAILELEKDGIVVRDPAPQSFQAGQVSQLNY
ncbi:penicillin-binding protein activator [Tistlia consotensis]|uniref:penicillin-binding protein activator n=1 Tax=Tistlia consotensis TaxID=1321365 RepID=UPI001356691D|nr:penicillin-binding protein activator [Tistlia consotensis]